MASVADLGRVAVGGNGVAVINNWDVVLVSQAANSSVATPANGGTWTDQKATITDFFSILPVGYGRLSAANKIVGRYHTGPGPMEELTLGTGLQVDASGNITTTVTVPSMTAPGLLGRYTSGAGTTQEVRLGTGLTIDTNGFLNVSGGGGGGSGTITLTGPNKLAGRVSSGTGAYEELTLGAGLSFVGSALTAPGPQLASGMLAGRTSTGAGGIEPVAIGAGLVLSGTTLAATQAQVATGRLLGRFAGTVGPQQEVQIGSGLTLTSAGVLSAAQPTVSAMNRVLGRFSTGSGPAEELTLGTGLTISGGALTVTVAGGSTPTLSGNNKLLGRVTAGAGAAEEINLGTGLALAAGNVLNVTSATNFTAASRLLGRGASGTGAGQEIALGAGLLMTGTVLSVSFPTQTPPQVGTGKLLGRFATGTGDAQEITVGSGLALSAGGVLTATGGAGTTLPAPAANTANQVLTANISGTIAWEVAESLYLQALPQFTTIAAFDVRANVHMGAQIVITAAAHVPNFDWALVGDGFVAEWENETTSDITPTFAANFAVRFPTGTSGKLQAGGSGSIRSYTVGGTHVIKFRGDIV